MTETAQAEIIHRALRQIATKHRNKNEPISRREITHAVSGRIRGAIGADQIIKSCIQNGVIVPLSNNKYLLGINVKNFVDQNHVTKVGAQSGPTTLYRFWDENSRLLYIGISCNGPLRWNGHRKEKKWWTDIRFATLQHFESRQDAEKAEISAIKNENPLYNCIYSNKKGQP